MIEDVFKTSYKNRSNVAITMHKKNILMNLFPLAMAKRAPTAPPTALLNAIGRARAQTILPCRMKRVMDPRLVAKLTSLALADALKKSKPRKAIKANIKKLPVPGPMKPS